MAGDGGVVEVSGETPPERILWMFVRVRYQARLTSSSITVAVMVVKRSNDKPAAWLPDNDDVGVFVGGIALSLYVGTAATLCHFCFRGVTFPRGSVA